jgi:ribose transport system permease protein
MSHINFESDRNVKIRKNLILSGIFILILILFNIVTQGRFLTISNINALISHSVIPTFIAWGMCFIFTTGTMDLSIGAIMILAANVAGILGLRFGYIGLILGGVVTAAVLEFINLVCYTKTKIPSWVAGLGMAMIYEAIGAFYSAQRISAGSQAVDLGNSCRALGLSPYNTIVWIAGLVIAYILFNYSSIGLNIRAVGGNKTVSGMMGVNTIKAVLLGGIVGGVFLGIAGAVNESYAGRIMPVTGLGSISFVFTPLAILLLAQAFDKTINLIVGVMISAVFISSMFNVLTIVGVPSGTWQEVVLGFSIIVFGILSQRKNKGVAK